MDIWKKLAINGYYYSTLPLRRNGPFGFLFAANAPAIVLFYHRVADTSPNPWTISRSEFSRQINWLKTHVDLVSLPEIQAIVRNGNSRRTAAHVTFDDGYAENCDFALPLLLAERIPFTYFVTVENMVRGVPFLHDAQRGAPLRPNTPEQIQSLVRSKVEIGAHSRTHPDLSKIESPHVLFDEVVTSRDELQNILQCPIRYFAAPFGQQQNLSRELFRLARAEGYSAVCSAYGGYNVPGGDDFHIQRIHGDPEFSRFVNHVSDDPFQRSIRPFDYGQATPQPFHSHVCPKS